jgi:hypothetical protein
MDDPSPDEVPRDMTPEERAAVLLRLLKSAGEHAHNVMVQMHQDMMPCWAFWDGENKLNVVGTPWSNDKEKRAMSEQIRRMLRTKKATAYSLVVEAWSATMPPGWKVGDPRIESRRHPDRIETVVAFATDGKTTLWRRWETKRDHLERVVRLEELPNQDDKMSSWMTELLPPRPWPRPTNPPPPPRKTE